MKSKFLIVEAHSDDSAISASGFLNKFKDKYDYHFLLMASSTVLLNHKGCVERDARLSEYQAYIDHFKGTWHKDLSLPFDAESKMDTIPKRDVVSKIETVINNIKPEIMLIQGPSFHHDHTIVYEACIAATRPTAIHCPSEIYIMENPTYVHSLGPSTDFKPDFYVKMSEEDLNKKLDLFARCFPTQIRSGPNYLSSDGIRAWSRYRGIEARCMYAEAFKTYQRVV